MGVRGPAGPASALAIALFGPFDVRLHGRPLPRLRSQKSQWLLALLALQEGRAVERAWLAGTLWPDSTERQAAFNLSRNLSDLRHALGTEARRLQAPTVQSLRLDLVGAEADILIFDEDVSRGDARSLEHAVALYRGPLLQGCEEEWVFQSREVREQAYLAALEHLAAQATACGDHSAAVHHLRRLVATDPLRDSTHRALMQALAALGDIAAATQIYRDFRLRLHQELYAAPDAGTTALYQQIRADARARLVAGGPGSLFAAPPATPAFSAIKTGPAGRIPRPLTRLVGRQEEVRAVCERLAEGPLVTLTGAGGIGKTRLAIQVAEESREQFPDGVWFVDLSGVAEAALVPPSVAAELGVRELAAEALTTTLQEFFAPRKCLLVLDNCEHLLEACARLVESLLSAAPRLRILTTSRQLLGLTGEVVRPVPPLSLPAMPDVSRQTPDVSKGAEEVMGRSPSDWRLASDVWRLLEFEAVRLFIERAAAATPSFALTERNAATVLQLCRRLDGMPLAIELAAARLRALSVEEMARRLDDCFRLLTGGSRTVPPRQQTLKATLDWSYALLSEPERALLRRLAVFAGGFTLEATEAVCGEPEGRRQKAEGSPDGRDAETGADAPSRLPSAFCLLPSDVLDLLTQLVDKSLVTIEWRGEGARYRLLETTREYALERLEEAGETERLRQRHLDWCLQMVEGPQPEAEEQGWIRRLEAEHENLRAALAWAMAADREAVLRLGTALKRFWYLRGHVTEGREWLDRILRAGAGPSDDPSLRALRAHALLGDGYLALSQGDHAAARAACEEALRICRELDDVEGMGECLGTLSAVCRVQGDSTSETGFTEEALRIHRALGQRGIEAIDLINLGLAAARRGEYAAARRWHTESLQICRELGAPFGEVYALHGLGSTAQQEGHFDEAERKFEESLRLARTIDDRRGIANALRHLVQLACDRDEISGTQPLVEECLTILRGLDDRWSLASLLIQQGRIAARQACWSEARKRLGEAAGLLQRLRDRTENSAALLEALADLAAREGADRRAVQLYGGAEAIWEALEARRPAAERAAFECHMGAARGRLDEPELRAAWEEGRAMDVEQAIGVVLSEERE